MYAIKHNNGTFFKQWTGIGPCFGATLKEARRFSSKRDAKVMTGKHYGFVGTEVVKVEMRELTT